ncbi:hypothetical protein QA645_20850 [Bradyrhizobium sp. CIAT3101]|uniref:hypothetical protein n=1 Tax=Bradyrhizobium sp. CIAT3101 TaxID=439387 RepID=UPI0024B0510E|nr:hypothetical protein [Bradyrhizobium sp. CIAT3101]WFU85095.1 hypothetical protein QA645_20850 [Bradyrhizobium sp. CIAT3101]
MAIFGFGRRSTPNSSKHIVPPELWDDPENAAFFARIGAKPDDPGNLRVSHADVARMIEEGRKAVDARIRQVRTKAMAEGHDNLNVRALSLLHDDCWNGEAGDFLIYHLGLNPYDEWNTMLVAGDVRTASILDMPFCTEEILQHLARTGLPLILGLRDKLRAAHDEVQRTHEFGRFQDIYDDTVVKVKRVAQLFGTGLVETYQAWRQRQADGRSAPR